MKLHRRILRPFLALMSLWLVPSAGMTQSERAVESTVQFVNVTESAGVPFRHIHGGIGKRYFIETMGPGCAFLDYDGDGNLDIYALNGHDLSGASGPRATNILYRNNGDGTFTDVTERAGVGDTGYGVGIAAADYDNDEDTDLYITNYGPNILYRNNGNGTFTEVTEKAGVGDEKWGVGCAFLDYDGDGYLDLYVANYVDFSLEHPGKFLMPYMVQSGEGITREDITGYPHPDNFEGVSDVLYRNNGDGTFTDVTQQASVLHPSGKGMGMVCGDYDNDGDVDIFVGNDQTPNFLYRNNGEGTFTEVALVAGVAYNEDGELESSMGADFGDYDNDGYLDLIAPNFQNEPSTLYHNDRTGFFSDVSFLSGIGMATLPFVGWGTGFFDYDNDGYLDIFIAMGHVLDNAALYDPNTSYPQRNFLFRNNGLNAEGYCTFTDVSSEVGEGLSLIKPSRGVAFGDYDNDGDVDLFIQNCNEVATLLRNDGGNRSHYLTVKTVGTKSNRDGIGARIRIVSGDRSQIREVKAGSSLYSQNDLRVAFGLGDRTTVDLLEIRWPSGLVETIKDIPSDQFLTVVEGIGIVGK